MKNPASIFVVEDNALTRKSIRNILTAGGYQVMGVAGNAVQALGHIKDELPNLVLVDIDLSGSKNGIWLVSKIRKNLPQIITIFLSGKADMTDQDLKELSQAHGFVPKPFSKVSLLTNVASSLRLYHDKNHNVSHHPVTFYDGKSTVEVQPRDVLYVKSDGNYVNVVLNEESLLLRNTLSQIEEKCPEGFVRVHQRYIVNTDSVEGWTGNNCIIQGKKIPISRKYRSHVQDFIR